MISIVPNSQLNFSFAFGQDNNDVLDELRKLFLGRYGEECYSRGKVIIVTHNKFFHVIKNAYHLPALYEMMDELEDYILKYTEL